MVLKIDSQLCTGCQVCVSVCPFEAIEVTGGLARERDGCTGCGTCVENCPVEAIQLAGVHPTAGPVENSAAGVLVFAEQHSGQLAPVVVELLGEGRRLADTLGGYLAAVVAGHGIEPVTRELAAVADRVYVADLPELARYRTEPYLKVLRQVVEEAQPEIFLFGATSCGRDLAPRLAALLKTGLTADCTGLDIDSEERLLLQTRPAFGGNLMATIACPHTRPQMATVRPGVLARRELAGTKGQIIPITPGLTEKDLRVVVRRVLQVESQEVRLEEAGVIVAGGRGLGGPEGFDLLKQLARALGGEVAGSRVAVENGWIEPQRQVGQTGKTVRPKLYVACGISGAIQHVAGMRESGYIIAVNKNPEAPIFKVADLGIVGDYRQVVPKWLEALAEGQGTRQMAG